MSPAFFSEKQKQFWKIRKNIFQNSILRWIYKYEDFWTLSDVSTLYAQYVFELSKTHEKYTYLRRNYKLSYVWLTDAATDVCEIEVLRFALKIIYWN